MAIKYIELLTKDIDVNVVDIRSMTLVIDGLIGLKYHTRSGSG
jgi:hypothetical protein